MTDLEQLRQRTGLGLDRMARLLGVDRQTVHRWTHGKSVPPKAALLKMRQFLRLTEEELATVATLLTRVPVKGGR